MDTGSKTLAQLSEENKEKKYVTLETGSKISGYTKDYLERLCLLNKVEYRLWSNGNFVIELESLLRETSAILLSFEGVTFVDKNELTDSVPQIVSSILTAPVATERSTAPLTPAPFEDSNAFKTGIAQALPTFGQTLRAKSESVSVASRAVISDALHPEEIVVPPPVSLGAATVVKEVSPTTPPVEAKIVTPTASAQEVAVPEEQKIVVPKFNMSAVRGETEASTVPEKTVAEKVHEHVPIAVINSPQDEWDNALLSKREDDAHEAPRHIPIVKDMGSITPDTRVKESSSVPAHEVASNTGENFAPPAGQKVTVFAEHKSVMPVAPVNPEPVLEEKVVTSDAVAVPTPLSVTPSAPVATPTAEAKPVLSQTLLTTSGVLPMLTATPELHIPTAKKEAPLLPSSPKLPMTTEEHHLTPYETHPLMKSTGFNIVFAMMLIASSFMMLGGKVLENVGGKVNTAEYVAGVGAITGGVPAPLPTKEVAAPKLPSGERIMLPFSNEIIATSGKKANSLIIQPVFNDGPGKSYEYILVPEGDATSTISN